jgi:uncharacterized protein YyaL (SSP411 family)
MMLAALARASFAFNDPLLLDEAMHAISFIKKNLYDAKNKILYRQYRSQKAGTQATLADYAWLINGLLEVYQAGNDAHLLSWAIELQNRQNELFLDDSSGAYYESSAEDANLLFRSKSIFDAALPSANAIALSTLRKLAELSKKTSHKKDYSARADKLVSSFAKAINYNPVAAGMLLAIETK